MPWPETVKSFGTVVITGGSSGIGAAFIRTMVKIDTDLVVFNLSRSVLGKFDAKDRIFHLPTDLSDLEQRRASVEVLNQKLREGAKGPILLINNAGFGHYGGFSSEGVDDQGMIDLNVSALVGLTGALLPLLRERGGAVINVSSIAGFMPLAYFATYAATKAFVLNWSLALAEELRPGGVRVLAVCPGPTESQFFRRAGFDDTPGGRRGQTAEQVVEESLRALHRGRTLVVTGLRNRLVTRLTRLLSRPLQARLALGYMKRHRLKELKTGGMA